MCIVHRDACCCLLEFELMKTKFEKTACGVFSPPNYLNPNLHYLLEIAVLDPVGNDCSIILL